MAEPTITGAMLQRAKGPELVSNLKKLSEELEEWEQTEDQESLKAVAAELGSAKLLRHRDGDVKLLTACCLSDVLRIFAPESPYENDTLKMVFELFISQLRGLQDDEGASFARYTYLVERLAMVKSFVLMLDLNFDDLVRQLVEVLLDSASESHPVRVSGYMLSIIVTTLEELAEDGIPTPLLDAILENLLPARQTDKPASFNLARQVLERCADDLQQPLQAFIEGCLPTGSGMTVESEIREEWPKLLFELTAIMPEIVTYLLPQLQGVISSGDENNRLQGVELLASLFTLSNVNIVHASLIHCFVGKFVDSSVIVRIAMVEHGVELLRQLPPPHAEPIVKALQARFLDPDERVRTALINHVCEACSETVGALEPLLLEVGSRVQDKKAAVRSAARATLCMLYRKHLNNAALHWIPQKLLSSYGHDNNMGSSEGCREIEGLMNSTLLPQQAEPRLRALCSMHAALQPRHRKVLHLVLLRGKRQAQQHVAHWLELQAKLKVDPKDKALKAKIVQVVTAMSSTMAEPPKAKEVWEQLAACKDKNIARHMAVLSSPASEYDEVRRADSDLRKCMAQRLKTEQLGLLSTITARPAMWFLCRSGAQRLLQEVAAELRGGVGDEELPTLPLLLDVASEFPAIVEEDSLLEAMQAAVSCTGGGRVALLQLLRIVHAANTKLAQASASTRKALIALLCQQACSKDAACGKLATQCLTTQLLVPAVREKTFSLLVCKLAAAVSAGRAGPQQHCALSVLGVLAKRSPEALGAEAPALVRQVKAIFEQRGAAQVGGGSSDVRQRCGAQLLALKMLANAAIGSCAAKAVAEGEGGQNLAFGRKLAELMLKVLGKEGTFGAAADAGAEEQGQLRLAVACALLKLLRVSQLQIEIFLMEAPERWHALGMVMQDRQADVREAFALKLSKELGRAFNGSKNLPNKAGTPPHFLHTRKLCVPPYYMAFFALAAVDEDKELATKARGYLASAAANFRRNAEHHKEAHPQHAIRMMPEMQLPHLVHLLAHHPQLSGDDGDEEAGSLHATQKCLDLFLGTVAAGPAPQYDLLRVLLCLVKRAPDRMAPERRAVHVVADVCRSLIGERTKGGWVTTIVPENVGLPRHLFSTEGHPPYDDVDMLPHGFSLVEGVAKGSGGGASKRTVTEPPSTPGKKKRESGSRSLAKGLALPSPLPSAGSSRKKPRRQASGASKACDGSSEEASDASAAEGGSETGSDDGASDESQGSSESEKMPRGGARKAPRDRTATGDNKGENDSPQVARGEAAKARAKATARLAPPRIARKARN